MSSDRPIASTTSLSLALCGLLASACGSGGLAGASDGGGGSTGTKHGAVIVEASGLATGTPAYFGSAAFSDLPRLLQAGEYTSLEFGIGEPDGCTKRAVGGCQVYRCPRTIEATPIQFAEPNVGAITISWPPAPGSSGGDGRSPVTLGPLNCYGLFWQTGTVVPRFEFSAAGGAIPAFPPTDVDAPQLFEITELAGAPLGPPPPPSVPHGADLRVTWTGGTADAVFVLQQLQFGPDNNVSTDLRAVCRTAASAGSFTFSSSVLGEFQPGDVSLDAAAVSSKVVAAGGYATTLAIAAPLPWHFPFTLE